MDALRAINTKTAKSDIVLPSSSVSSSRSNLKRDPNNDITTSDERIHANVSEINKATTAKINRIAEAMDNYVQSAQRDLKIQVHSATGNIMVKVISEQNGKVIREIPPKELLDLAARMEEMVGALFNESA